MTLRDLAADDRAALVYTAKIGLAAVGGAVAAFAVVGWFGVGLAGLTGLWFVNDHRAISRDEEGDIAYPDYRPTAYADALHAQARRNHLQQLAAEGRCQQDIAAERAFQRYLKNTVFLAVTVFGFGMSFLHG